MKRTCLSLLLSLVTFVIYAQPIEFSPMDYQDPAVFEKGQNPPRAFHVPFNNKENALGAHPTDSDNYMSLNGSWKFKWVERPGLVPENFPKPDYNTKDWDSIKVPSNWQMEGYGHPKFRNVAMSFENNIPYPPNYYNPTGCYKRTFSIPANWTDKKIVLRFEGIKSASYVWVNGNKVGYNQGGFEPAEYNITEFVKAGPNDIAVQVIRFSDGSYLENQDMWRLSGIYRDVKLVALPKTCIQDYYYITDLDEAYKNATLKVEVTVEKSGDIKSTSNILEVDVLGNNHKTILKEKLVQEVSIGKNERTKKITLETHVENPLKWSAEYPNLYTILFTLKDNNGNILEAFTKKLGFREIEVFDEVVTINGVPIKLNGVNSHMHHPRHGQAVPLETLKKDLLIMKQFNINCVRTSHYPPTPEYLEMADELGMYIIDEVGDEAHANIHLSSDSTFTEMYRDRSQKLVYRDRNHASIIMWSAGNESGSGFNIEEVIKTGQAIDPSRPVWMYGGNTFHIPFEHVTGPRYWIPYHVKNLAERKSLGENDLRPSFMDEYLAATGNGLGGLDEYWDLIWKYPRLMGGAIWDWVSPAIYTPLWTIPDASPENNTALIIGRPIFADGKNGRALSFTGHDDWVEFYRSKSLDITGNQLTISFWVKPSKIPQPNTFITKGKHGYGIIMDTTNSLEFYVQSNTLYHTMPYLTKTSTRVSAKTTVPDDWYGNWHHVAGIYNGKELKLYIDGKEKATIAHTGNIAHTPFPLCIGREAETQDQGEYSGRMSSMVIDEMMILDTAIAVENLEFKKTHPKAVLAVDFENDTVQGEFLAAGLGGRSYGIVWPDRKIQPEIHQIKKSGQPIGATKMNLANGLVIITNRHHFKDLNEFDLHWSLMENGEEKQNGILNINLPAGQTKEVTIPFTKPTSKKEAILTISFQLIEPVAWAEPGHEVAFEQFIVKEKKEIAVATEKGKGKISYTVKDGEIHITGNSFAYTINEKTAQFTRFEFNGENYLENGPLFNIWRAPLSNDIDPWGAYIYSSDYVTPGLGRSIDNQLRTLGMKNLDIQVDKIKPDQFSEDKIEVTVHKYCNSTNMRGAFECIENYAFKSNGTITVQVEIIPHGLMPEILPKLGWQFQVPKSFSFVEWYGHGPFETYPDRQTGAKIGIYKSNADKEYVPYVMPQDYGNHTAVRWLKVTNSSGNGLMFMGTELLNFSYHKFSTENLSRAMYQHQLKEATSNYLNIDFEVSGVGGTAIRQLQKYRVKPSHKSFTITIKPF